MSEKDTDTAMDAQDWIILRLLMLMARKHPKTTVEYDPTKAMLYLHKKYGLGGLIKYCAQLKKERGYEDQNI